MSTLTISINRPDKRPGGRPALMRGGRRVQVYLDADAVVAAARLGGGNVSRGIRAALKSPPR